MLRKGLKQFLRKLSPRSTILILAGSAVWSVTMVKSGFLYAYGMGFWGPNGHDGIWHISLARSLVNGSWEMPVFAGENIRNYHIGFDLILAFLHKLTLIPLVNLYFQIIPPILALAIGLAVYKFVYEWKGTESRAFWATFFVYFGGSLGWLVTLFRTGEIGGESMFWSQQSISTLINPPFALSFLIMVLGLQYLIKGLRYKSKRYFVIATFLFGILIQIKVYAGLLVLGGLFVSGLWQTFNREGVSLFKVFAGSLIISLLLFSPTTGDVGSNVVFKPFWFLETMMSLPDRVGWQKFGEAMVNYKLGGVWIKGILAYLAAFVIFLVGNMGLRVIGGIWVVRKLKKIKKLGYLDVIVLSVITAGIVLPMLFVQKGTAWNIIQFFYFSLIFMGIMAGISFADLLRKLNLGKRMNIIIEAALLLLLVPSCYATLRHYLPSRPPAMISKPELNALEFISGQPDGVVLTLPFDRQKADAAVNNPPRPLYLYESTAYVSAFSGKPVYLEDEVNMDITDYDWRTRRGELIKFLTTGSAEDARGFLTSNNISYIYWVKPLMGLVREDQTLIKKIYTNSEIDIFRVN